MSSVRRALLFSFVERYALIVLSLASNILIARLLTPEEIGIYSVSLAVIGIAQVIRDFGIGNFLIQEKQLTEDHVRTAFAFSLLIGGILFMISYFGAPLAAEFYDKEQMTNTLRICSLNFLVLPFCTISLALLRREMQFKRMFLINLVAAISSFGITVGLAYSGFGANSMAIGAVVLNVFTGVGAWLARVDRKLLMPGWSEWRPILRFGGQSISAGIVTTIAMDINDLALGKILGFTPVAMISRAQGLMNLFHRDFMTAIRSVAFPAFSKAHRNGADLELQHTNAIGAITAVAWPFYAFCSVFSLELLRLLFGSQWDDASPLVPWFCLAGAIAAPCSLITTLLIAIGRNDLSTRVELIIQPLRASILVLGVASSKTIETFAILYPGVFAVAAMLLWFVKEKAQHTNYRKLRNILFKSTLVTLISMIPVCLISIIFSTDSAKNSVIAVLVLAGFSCLTMWIASISIVHHPMVDDLLFGKLVSRLNLKPVVLIALSSVIVLICVIHKYIDFINLSDLFNGFVSLNIFFI